ncbi:MAG: NAD(P)/FAD-dependent oxidoreductase [Actinomycetota bacterium]|nr:NAD(P)/FAD-dependent oxidoreductase [Actinomycetota bacterium]
MTSLKPATDSTEIRDLTIIGAGPVGLSAAFWAGMRQASCRIVDSLPDIGGQLTTLYPEKWIFDVPGLPRVLAKDLVASLREQALEQFDVPVHLETTAHAIGYEPDSEDPSRRIVVLETDRGQLRSRTVIVAGGHGAFEPKKLPVSDVDMEPWEGRGAHYLVSEKSEFEGKHVVIVGGGDSAFDWVVNLLDTAGRITLVHRRKGFRAHEATVAEVQEAAEAGRVDLRIPAVIRAVHGNGKIDAVELHHPDDESASPERLECDAVLLQLGFSTKLGPLKEWGFELLKGAIVVDPLMRTNLEGVWACGDITTFDGKLKLIATGFAESAIAVAQAVHSFRPDMRIQPAYSTNTGVPTATPEEVTPSYVDPPDVPGVAEGQV